MQIFPKLVFSPTTSVLELLTRHFLGLPYAIIKILSSCRVYSFIQCEIPLKRLTLSISTSKSILSKRKKTYSFILAISIAPPQVLYYSESLPTIHHGYCIGVSRRSAQSRR